MYLGLECYINDHDYISPLIQHSSGVLYRSILLSGVSITIITVEKWLIKFHKQAWNTVSFLVYSSLCSQVGRHILRGNQTK